MLGREKIMDLVNGMRKYFINVQLVVVVEER